MTYNNKIKQTIKENKLIFTKLRTNRYLTVNNPKPPTLNGFIKLYKLDMPIRPVITFKSGPSYNEMVIGYTVLCETIVDYVFLD